MSRGLNSHKKTIHGAEMTVRKLSLNDGEKMIHVCSGENFGEIVIYG